MVEKVKLVGKGAKIKKKEHKVLLPPWDKLGEAEREAYLMVLLATNDALYKLFRKRSNSYPLHCIASLKLCDFDKVGFSKLRKAIEKRMHSGGLMPIETLKRDFEYHRLVSSGDGRSRPRRFSGKN